MSTLAALLKTNTTMDVTEFLQAIVGNGTSRGPLMWGGRIYRWATTLKTNANPELSLLRAVVMADSANILADLSDPTNDLILEVFHDVPGMNDGTDGIGWSSIDYARWLFEKNTPFTEGLPDGEHSKALSLLIDYIAGDLHDTRQLLQAIASRVWRNIRDESHDALRLATFVLHTYAVYYNGWDSSVTSHNSGLKHLHRRYLAGESIAMAGETEWHTPSWETPSDSFPIYPPFTSTFLDDQGAMIEHTWSVTIGDDVLQFVNYGEDGVAITTRVGDDTFVHFIDFPMTYSYAISNAFNTISYGDDFLRGLRGDDETDIVSIVDTEEHKESHEDALQVYNERTGSQPVKSVDIWMEDGESHSHVCLI